ncbi:glycoside hydrolase family 130 protein [uncultured Lutibacter sp.]|uniref:glycoside hydrolase family 130 protein n=1 Tax=uncultured Lutibacter sp. TaxID=437739 RepID=UPI00260B6C27|nr:glycoside hydrolase family 130 protein [uncultured Lutibacter sp.]
MQIKVNRKNIFFSPDSSRVIARFNYSGDEKSKEIILKILELSEEQAKEELIKILRGYSKRHRNISIIFEHHFYKLSHILKELKINTNDISNVFKTLIGSYFTKEYSIESAAFFNPSMVEDPDQSMVQKGEKRVILSFRATGEGHISSIVFRSGILDENCNLKIKEPGKMLNEAKNIKRHAYNKDHFFSKLFELHKDDQDIASKLFSKLPDHFSYGELERVVKKTKKELNLCLSGEILCDEIMWLASSHYEIIFSLDTDISERVIFPVSENEKNGIEDARFVKFIDDNGEITYCATYTAYDGITILPKLMTTKNFYHFTITPINGEVARNKGMALFPRKINGQYAMLCRIDGINNYISFSNDLNRWNEAKLLQKPKYPWEFVQVGNCGSPIETKDGWLVITHAVGQMREYVMGASLFEFDHPEIEIGRLKMPLMIPNEVEREGYVPNVIYSCGSIIHNGNLCIPYAMSDRASSFATVNLEELLSELKR